MHFVGARHNEKKPNIPYELMLPQSNPYNGALTNIVETNFQL